MPPPTLSHSHVISVVGGNSVITIFLLPVISQSHTYRSNETPFLHRWSKSDLSFTTFFFFLTYPCISECIHRCGALFFPPYCCIVFNSMNYYSSLGGLYWKVISHFQWFAITGNLVCILFCLSASVPVG